MKSTIIYGLALLCLLAASCGPSTQEIAKSNETKIPKLLDRSEAIQNGKEWDKIQNIYAVAKEQTVNNPKNFEPYIKLTEVFITEARVTGEHGHYYPSALATIDYVLKNHSKKDDTRFRALSLKASVMLSQHEFKQAKEIALKAIKLNPYNASIYGALVDAYVELGEYDQAVKTADQMMAIRPDLRSYARVSYLREIHGEVDGAIKSMKMAVAAGFPGLEETCWTRLTLGELYQKYGYMDEAKNQFERALAERENYPFAIAALADLAIADKNYEKGEKLLNEACNIIPEVGFYMQKAALLNETGRAKEMQKLIPLIDEMLEDDVKHGHNMNMEYADFHENITGDFEKALKYTNEEFEKRPNNISVNLTLSNLYLKLGDSQKSEQHLVRAKQTGSIDPDLIKLEKHFAANRTEGSTKLSLLNPE